ncbi:hypothetical protein [Limnochorda pilosa]|uniref:Outer membrane protein beta-barrel domain-containing protein n=1 Tax=Limnochorda pilosa TaxID=1555112 RepID=A0A0K2SNJ9_LIMPI|nr:hypothetical protein [Limnochorda pilosa]BAS28671.1 hypothetical protein LIP_2842 [Limnochorda pilosa]
MRRVLYAIVALALAIALRAPAALAFSPELSLEGWWSRIAREDRAGDQISRSSRSLPQAALQLDLDLTSRFGLEGELVAPPERLAGIVDRVTGDADSWPPLGYRVDATYRLPIIGVGVGPTYVHSVLAPKADEPVVEVGGLGGVATGSASLSDRLRLTGSVRHLPDAVVREAGEAQKATYTGYRVGAGLTVWHGLEAQVTYRQERVAVPNPMPGVQERTYQQGGYTLGVGYRF